MRVVRNVLILHASAGAGHQRAAEAIEAAFRREHPSVHVKTMDILDLSAAVFKKVYAKGYLGLVHSAPRLWGYLYEKMDRPSEGLAVGDSLRRALQGLSMRAFHKFITAHSWDLVISTHFLPIEALARLRSKGKIHIPHAGVVTDFDAHHFWVQNPCDHYFTASAEAAASLIHWGLSPERVSITGIPVHEEFSKRPSASASIRAHALEPGLPVILQMGGGHGTGPVEEVYRRLLELRIPCQIVTVAGKNEKLYERLLSIPAPLRHRVKILRFTDKIHELMAAASLIVSKSGGLTVSESLAMGKPLAVVNPIPGQEERNCDFLLENGAAVKFNNFASIAPKIERLLSEPERLAEMARRAKSLGRPRAAAAVAGKSLEVATDFFAYPNLAADNFLSARTGIFESYGAAQA